MNPKKALAAVKQTPAFLKKLGAAAKEVITDLAKLETPAVATSIAGAAAPIIAALLGMNITAAELGGYLAVVGLVAATLQKITAKSAPAKAGVSPVAENAYCIIHGTPGKTPLTIEGPFATQVEAQANADADAKAIPTVPVLVDVLVNPANC